MGQMLGIVVVVVVLAALLFHAWRVMRRSVVIAPGWQGLLYRDGEFRRVLQPGRHDLPLFGRPHVRRVWMQPVTGYPIIASVITRDQFAFRVTLAPVSRVTDARLLDEGRNAGIDDPGDYGALLDPFIRAAATRRLADLALDEFMAGRDAAVAAIRDDIAGAVPGLAVENLLLTELAMPPEVRRMFTEIERARREGLAALERARAEQASLRALANAARALQSNPALAQLRMIQAAEGAKGAKTIVLHAPPAGPGAADDPD